MNLRSSDPFWLYRTPFLNTYNRLTENLQTEVAIVGGGISGALAAYELVKAGCKVLLLSATHIGTASTCASTSLLQYEIDTPLHELIKKVGDNTAIESYLLCHDAIDELEKIHNTIGVGSIFERRKSLLLASYRKHVPDLQKEYEVRVNAGIKVDWVNQQKMEDIFGFGASAAIYSLQGAQTDAYLFTQMLIKWCSDRGMKVYDKTEVNGLNTTKNKIELTTKQGYKVTAENVVMATGYEATKWIGYNVARLHSTYVIVSERLAFNSFWKDRCLIWETARPYTYIRTTNDNRIIVGGKDEPFSSAGKRDALIASKSKQLVAAYKSKFPNTKLVIEHSWTGTFAETRDGLPFIGSIPKHPRVFYALGYGGNGITFSQIASKIICDSIIGKKNPYKNTFGFDRINHK